MISLQTGKVFNLSQHSYGPLAIKIVVSWSFNVSHISNDTIF